MAKTINKPDEPVEGQILRRAFDSTIKSIDADKRQVEFIISTATADRYGDTIQVKGWDLKHYKKNPVVLFGHNSSIPPVGKAVKVWKDGEALRAIAQFMPADMSAFADSIFRMYQEQFLRATSVGFIPIQYEPILDDEGNPTWSYNFLKQELLEFSCVPVPANPEALISARHKGIDTTPIKQWVEEMLDDWKVHEKEIGSVYRIGRKEMETMRRRAAGAGATFVVPQEQQDAIRQRNLEAIRKHKEEKAKVSSFETVSIRGVDYDLPARKNVDKVGEVLIHKDVNGTTNPVTIKKADDNVLFSLGLLEEEKDIINVELRQDDKTQELFVDLKTAKRAASYQILGVTEKDELYGVKVKDVLIDEEGKETPTTAELLQAMQDAEVVDLTGDDNEEEKNVNGDDDDAEDDNDSDDDSGDEDDAGDDDGDDDDEDDSDDESDETDDDDEVDDEKAAAAKTEKKVKGKAKAKTPKVVELTFGESLSFMETILCDFEDGLKDTKAASAHDVRKANFLAGYMRELADRLDGGKKGAEAKTTSSKKQEEEEHKFTPNEAKDYVSELVRSLQPALADIVAKKLAQKMGRLD